MTFKKYAVIVAGGSGERMGNTIPKQFIPLRGKPVVWYSVQAFLKAFSTLEVILVLPEAYFHKGAELLRLANQPERIHLITGGSSRFQSVKNGLKLVQDPSIVFVHDGVRCLITPRLIQHCYEVAVEKGTAIPAIPCTDSVRVEKDGYFGTADRNKIKLVQTPQTFQSRILKLAFEVADNDMFTDEAAVAEAAGIKINVIDGEPENIKITRPIDLLLAEQILISRDP